MCSSVLHRIAQKTNSLKCVLSLGRLSDSAEYLPFLEMCFDISVEGHGAKPFASA